MLYWPSLIEHTRWSKDYERVISAMHYNFWGYFIFGFDSPFLFFDVSSWSHKNVSFPFCPISISWHLFRFFTWNQFYRLQKMSSTLLIFSNSNFDDKKWPEILPWMWPLILTTQFWPWILQRIWLTQRVTFKYWDRWDVLVELFRQFKNELVRRLEGFVFEKKISYQTHPFLT
jgi:hypothetical protein